MLQIKTLLILKLISDIAKAIRQTQSWSSSGHTVSQKVKVQQFRQNICSIESTCLIHSELLVVTEQLRSNRTRQNYNQSLS